MNNKYKKIISIIFAITFFIGHQVNASILLVKPSNDILGIGEQFYVDIMLDTEGKVINGVEGSIVFPSDILSFVRAEEGQSMVSLWVEKPEIKGNNINFSGIIPNGFSGVINPFEQNKKLPGLVVRLVFEPTKEGNPEVTSSQFYTTLNDGLGTIDNIEPSSVKLSVQNYSKKILYKTDNDVTPELSAYITRDPNLFNNQYVLIFDAKDRQTGIKEVLIKEGKRSWKKIESPYLLGDQTRHSIITLQAINYSGSGIAINIDPLPYNLYSVQNVSIVIVFLIILVFIIKKVYEKYKKTD